MLVHRAFNASMVLLLSGVVVNVHAGGTQAAETASGGFRLVWSDPSRGGRMGPRRWVKLQFNGSLDAGKVRVQVRDDVGGQLEAGRPEVSGSTVVQRVTPGLAAGHYSIGYSVTDNTGHQLNGDVPFQVVVSLTGANKPTSSYKPGPSGPGQNGKRKTGPPVHGKHPASSATPVPQSSAAASLPAAEPASQHPAGTNWWLWGVAAMVALLAPGAVGLMRWARRR